MIRQFPDRDPSGESLVDMAKSLNPAQVQNLKTHGYEQLGDARNPHITSAWPLSSSYRFPLSELPPPEEFVFFLSRVGAFRESPQHGACVESLGGAGLSQGLLGTERGELRP